MTPRAKKPKKSSEPDKSSSKDLNQINNDMNIEESSKMEESTPEDKQPDTLDNNLETTVNRNDFNKDELFDPDPFMDDSSEALRTETIQPKYHEKPTVPRKAFINEELNDDLFNEIDNIYDSLEQPESEHEDFVKDITASLINDEFIKGKKGQTETKEENQQYSPDLDGSDLVADIEEEIERAPNAENPFTNTSSEENSDGIFLSQLNEIFTEDSESQGITSPEDDLDELPDNELSLSSESWQEVLEATKDNDSEVPETNLFLNRATQTQANDSFFDQQWQNDQMQSLSDESIDISLQDEDTFTSSPDFDEDQDESVSTLRQSFIEVFEQTPWPDEDQVTDDENLGWFQKQSRSFKNWVSSLNTGERLLIIMSSLISLAIIVAIVLVFVEWRKVSLKESPPPQAIELSDQNIVYPTGIQLPGGWFFYLQPGEIKNSKWNPQTAEWLQNTTVRRVVAIPWSRQAEAVVQSLSTGDEINLYMNNNDINTYYVEDAMLIERDNVEILTDTEPSLAVILFKQDNSNRWVVIARP